MAQRLILQGSKIRLSEGAYLNDTSEGKELFKFLPALGDISQNSRSDTIAQQFTQRPFIGSYVADSKHDDLNLWRMYGKENKEEAKGCAITLDRIGMLDGAKNNLSTRLHSKTSANSTVAIGEDFNFYRVAYRTNTNNFVIPEASNEDQETLNDDMNKLYNLVHSFTSNPNISSASTHNLKELLNGIAYLFKTTAYQYEHEIRLVVKGVGLDEVVDENFHPPRVYIEMMDIGPLIKKITIGPKVDNADEWAAAFFYKLKSKELYPEILISHLPFK